MPGEVLLSHNLAKESLPHLIRAASLEPSEWRHFVNLSIAYRKTCQYDEARLALERASSLQPDAWQVWHTWAQLLDEEGRFEDCLNARWKAWELCGQKNQDAAMGLAWSLMRLGRWREAWPFWEAGRFMRCWYPPPGIEPWQGEDLKGKRLLILPEGGYGDAFMYGRWIPKLMREGAGVTFHVWDSAIEILKLSPDLAGTNFIPLSGPISAGDYDFVTSLMSIPAVLGECPEDIPESLTFDVEQREGTGAVGLCWSAEEAGTHRKIRSLPLPDAERFKNHGLELQSLVPNDGIDWMKPCPKNWVGTAKIISSLETVVTVDTAVAHLSGCMGKPTILMLPVHSSWQWGVEGNEPDWYDDMLVVRCQKPDDWSHPVSRAIAVLTEE